MVTTVVAAAGCLAVVAIVAPWSPSEAAGGVRAQLAEPTTSTSTSAAPPTVSLTANGLPTPELTLSAPDEVEVGSAASITATVTDADTTGEIAVLEQVDDDTETAVSSARVDADGTVALTVTQTEPATYTYRLRLPATTLHKAAESDGITVDVVEEVPTPEPTESPEPSPTETPSPTEPPEPTEPPQPLCGGQAPLKADGRAWVCTYDDEFDGDSLDRRFWVPQRSVPSKYYSGTTTQPACFIDDPQTIRVDDGDLVLGAKVLDAPISCGPKSTSLISGMVTHHGTLSQTYGKYEVRAKLPDWSGKGLQETLWLWPNDQLKYGLFHPSSGEIDFGEFYSNYGYLNIPVMHYLFDPSTISLATNTNIYTSHYCTIRVGEYNTYGLEWFPGQVRILINDQVCITNNYVAYNAPPGSPYAPFDSPFFLSLTQAFGTTGNEFDLANGPRESGMRVDWVRVWE